MLVKYLYPQQNSAGNNLTGEVYFDLLLGAFNLVSCLHGCGCEVMGNTVTIEEAACVTSEKGEETKGGR